MTPEQHVAEAAQLVRDAVRSGGRVDLEDVLAHIGLAELAARAPEVTR